MPLHCYTLGWPVLRQQLCSTGPSIQSEGMRASAPALPATALCPDSIAAMQDGTLSEGRGHVAPQQHGSGPPTVHLLVQVQVHQLSTPTATGLCLRCQVTLQDGTPRQGKAPGTICRHGSFTHKMQVHQL